MPDLDHENLGTMIGIEIHQQMSTSEKLFCSCPVELQNGEADTQVERFLKAVAGETGEKDVAARVEEGRSRKFVYNYYTGSNCLVELDEEPPHPLNLEALDAALTFARMVDAEIPREIQVMRKLVVDGSNTSGFQRTAMVGLNGELETETGKVAIEDIELEEESAGIHSRGGGEAVYDLNRLGIPLVEVGTDASIQNPAHAREVATRIGMLLRSTGKARRGLGTIRQDVNVSISEGSRVEIKGFQDVENIDRLIELEVRRQKNLVELGEELNDVEMEEEKVTDVFENSENQIVSTVVENDGAVHALKLPGLAGKMKEEISGDRYLALELVDYAKSRGLKGMIHTDEDLENYNLDDEFDRLADRMNSEPEDVLAILAGPQEKVEQAAEAVRERAEQLYRGEVPEETRNAEQEFTTSYSRPLPGAARMYPETDIPPIAVSREKVDEIDENLPETLEKREEKYAEEIGEELASQIVSSPLLPMFEKFRDRVDTKLAANVFTNIYSRLEAEGEKVENLAERHFRAVFEALEKGVMEKGHIEDVLSHMTGNPEKKPGEAVEQMVKETADEEEIREAVREVLEEKKELVEEEGIRAQGALMGVVMEKVDAPGDKVSQVLQEELEKRTD